MKIVDIIDDIELNEIAGELLDRLSVLNLTELREEFIFDYERILFNGRRSTMSTENPEEKAFELSRRIEAVDLILSHLSPDHTSYDIRAFGWWDDKEEI